MTGWTKVFLATAIMVVALAGFNLVLWRRLREARRLAAIERPDDADPAVPVAVKPTSESD